MAIFIILLSLVTTFFIYWLTLIITYYQDKFKDLNIKINQLEKRLNDNMNK